MTQRHVPGPADGAPRGSAVSQLWPWLLLLILLSPCQSLEINVPVLALKSSAVTLSVDPRVTWPHTLCLWIEKRGSVHPSHQQFPEGLVWLLPLGRAQSLDDNERVKPAHVAQPIFWLDT